MTHASVAWSQTTDNQVKKLQVFQNAFLRQAMDAPWFVRNNQLHREAELPLFSPRPSIADMRINRKLLPIKSHFFFFMAAMGPILPQLSVYGKELGISSVVMGSITGILPFAFLLAKPVFGLLVDVFRDYRKAIFMALIVIMTLSYALMNFIPPKIRLKFDVSLENRTLEDCNSIDYEKEQQCDNETVRMICTSTCFRQSATFLSRTYLKNDSEEVHRSLCRPKNSIILPNNTFCNLSCNEDIEVNNGCLYGDFTFWSFVILMSIGTIGFNVVNSISDAICFDVIGEQYDYGKQRVWGTIGFGITALIGGYLVDMVSGVQISYTPAFIVMLIFSILDLISCFKLELPIIEAPKNIVNDFKKLLGDRHVIVFLTFAALSGIADGFIIYFLIWYIEDLSIMTNTVNIKFLQGLIVAAETLGGEIIFFSIAGKILERLGHVKCFSICFVNYALRLGLVSLAPNPWYILPIEFVFQGPTYALTYTTVVAYANELAPPGVSATMQGIAAGMDDGLGYAVGSIVGGIIYKYMGGKAALQIFSILSLVCGIAHYVIHRVFLPEREKSNLTITNYKNPEEAAREVDSP